MAFRFETASGLRLYACSERLRMGETSSIRFLDPFENQSFVTIEILFESKSLAKSCRLNNTFLHAAFYRHKIIPKSLFLHEVDNETVFVPGVYTVRKDNAEEILSSPWKLV
jgi:hypothetical protein